MPLSLLGGCTTPAPPAPPDARLQRVETKGGPGPSHVWGLIPPSRWPQLGLCEAVGREPRPAWPTSLACHGEGAGGVGTHPLPGKGPSAPLISGSWSQRPAFLLHSLS